MENNTTRTTRLELFRHAIDAQANAETSELVRQSEEKRAAIARERSENSTNEALSEVRAEYDRTAAEFKRELSRCDHEMKKAVLAHRHRLTTELFNEVREKLLSFSASPEYSGYLKNATARAENELGAGTIIRVRPADIAAVRELTSLTVEPDSSIILGGITAVAPEKGLCLDLTLDSRLLDEEAAFSAKAELRL
mgnify:FL=1